MKVTVCFDDTKVVVPCGNGSNSIQHLINEAFSRYKKVAPKGRDLSHLEINDMKLSLKDGGILDSDDKIVDVLEDKEQILAIFQENEILNGSKDLISSILDLKAKVQGHSSPISESPKNEVFEDSMHEDVYCIITAEDLKSDSHLHVKQNVETTNSVQNDSCAFLDENFNQVSKGITKGKFLEKADKNEKPDIIGDNGIPDLGKLIEMVTLKNDSPILGIHVMPEYNDNEDLTGLKVRSIEKNGLADKDGRLKCGDVIIEINKVSLYKVDFAVAQEIFKCARDDPELHLKVIHKGRNAINEDVRKQEHNNQKIKEPCQDEKPDLTQQRKEFASMMNLSHNTKEPREIYSSHTLKSVSMNDLMDDSNFYHNKVCSSLSEDDYDDDDPTGHVVMSKSQKKSMKLKEMFANDQGFNRRKAYDSLNRAVDKSIDILNDPGLKEKNKKQGIFRGVKPNPVKKQHWWSRLKLNKKNKDDSKKTKKESTADNDASPSKTLIADKQIQSKSKSDGNTSDNANTSTNFNNNNNSNVSNNDKHGPADNKPRKDKSSIEWMHRVSWLGSTSESLDSQTNSRTSKIFDLNQPDVKICSNGKVANVAVNEFENISGNKTRSRSAARIERKALNGGFNQGEVIIQTKASNNSPMQSRSIGDLSANELQNGHVGAPSRGHLNFGGRAISHYKAGDANFQKSHFTHINHPSPHGDYKHDPIHLGRSDAEMTNRRSAPHSYAAHEKLFGRSDCPDYLDNKRLPIILKESHHREGLVKPGGINNPHICKQLPHGLSWAPINTTPQHHHYQDHLMNANVMSKHHEKGSNLNPKLTVAANQKGRFMKDPIQYLMMDHPNVYSPSINGRFQNGLPKPYHRQPISQLNPRVILPPPPISDHFLPSTSINKPHRDISNERLEEIVHFQPYNDRVQQHYFSNNPQQGFYHMQQSSDVTDYGNGFQHVTPGHRRDSYDAKR